MQLYNHLTMMKIQTITNAILMVLLIVRITHQEDPLYWYPDPLCRSADIGTSEVKQSSASYWVNQICPDTASDDVRALCEESTSNVTSDLMTLIPVTSDSETFFNKYCAACYNISKYELWSVNISCTMYVDFQNTYTQKDIISKALSLPYCNVALEPPMPNKSEICHSPGLHFSEIEMSDTSEDDTEYTLSDTWLEKKVPLSIILNFNNVEGVSDDVSEDAKDNETCSSVQWSHKLAVRFFNRKFVKRRKNLQKDLDRTSRLNMSKQRTHGSRIPQHPYSQIKVMEACVFSSERNHYHIPTHFDSYSDNIISIYLLQETCLDVHCFPGKQLIGDRCVSIIKDGRGLMYRFPLTLRSVSMVKRYDCDLKESVKEVMLTIAGQLKIESFECDMTSRFLKDDDADQATQKAIYMEIGFIFQLVITQTIPRDRFENDTLALLDRTWNMTCGQSVVRLTTVGQNQNFIGGPSSMDLPFPPQTHTNIHLEYMSYFGHKNSSVTLTPFLLCRFIIFGFSQYEQHDFTVTIHVQEGPISLFVGEYDITDDGDLRVCVDVLSSRYDTLFLELQTNRSDVYNIHHEIQMYLSYVCITLSVLGLLTTFIVYMVFPSLRSLPAKNNICLVFNLFWAQLLLQFGIKLTENRPLCQTLGVLIHFFWLSALLSMNVCSYHMHSVFSCHKMAVMPKHSSTKRLIKYIAYTYTLSALIVTSTIISQYIITDGRSIGYGDRYCYLSSALLIGFAFALPLGIILLLNGIMFVLAVRSIARTSRIQRRVLSKGRQNLHVYIKLSTLTGLFWFVGILAEFSQWNIFTYMSIILNGSQGIFIFVACICNKRVLHLTGCFKKPSYKTTSSDSNKTLHTRSVLLSDTTNVD